MWVWQFVRTIRLGPQFRVLDVCAGTIDVGVRLLKRQPGLWLFLLMNLASLVMLFKHGFVRSDDHIYRFFAHAIVIFSLILPVARNLVAPVRRVCIPVTIVCLAAMTLVCIPKMWSRTITHIGDNSSFVTSGLLGRCLTEPQAVIEQAKAQVRQEQAAADLSAQA